MNRVITFIFIIQLCTFASEAAEDDDSTDDYKSDDNKKVNSKQDDITVKTTDKINVNQNEKSPTNQDVVENKKPKKELIVRISKIMENLENTLLELQSLKHELLLNEACRSPDSTKTQTAKQTVREEKTEKSSSSLGATSTTITSQETQELTTKTTTPVPNRESGNDVAASTQNKHHNKVHSFAYRKGRTTPPSPAYSSMVRASFAALQIASYQTKKVKCTTTRKIKFDKKGYVIVPPGIGNITFGCGGKMFLLTNSEFDLLGTGDRCCSIGMHPMYFNSTEDFECAAEIYRNFTGDTTCNSTFFTAYNDILMKRTFNNTITLKSPLAEWWADNEPNNDYFTEACTAVCFCDNCPQYGLSDVSCLNPHRRAFCQTWPNPHIIKV